MAGWVHNPSFSETVTVRLAWRGLDATGATVATASARIPWLRPGERRPFNSSPFFGTNGQIVMSCQAISLERMEAVADPIQVP